MTTLIDLLHTRASQADSALLVYLADGEGEEERRDYATLDAQARALGARLQAEFEPGERALLLFGPGLEAVTGYFGALYAGLIPVPVMPPRPGQSPAELLSFAADARPSVLLTSAALSPKVAGMLAASGGPKIPIVAADAPEASGDDWTRPDVSDDDIATLLYTSGSTSRPRGVCLSHRALLERLQALDTMRHWESTSGTIVSWVPLSHAMGLFANVLQPLYGDFRAVILSPVAFAEKPVRWLRTVTRYGGTTGAAPNFGFQMCVDRIAPEEREGLDLSTWKRAILSSETIRLDTLDAFADAYAPYGFSRDTFQMAYGLSEGFATGTFNAPREVRESKPLATTFDRDELLDGRAVAVAPEASSAQTLVRCGVAPEGREVIIVDAEARRPLAEGAVGEVWIRGAGVADGYWQNPEATEETFGGVRADTGEGGYLRSGDLGFYHEGELYVAGRLKDMIIVRGKNLYAADIEALAESAHPAIQQASSAAFAIDENNEEHLVVAVESPETIPDVDAIASAVRRAVGEAINLPVHSVVVVESGSLPRTRSGKIQRYQAREQFLAAR